MDAPKLRTCDDSHTLALHLARQNVVTARAALSAVSDDDDLLDTLSYDELRDVHRATATLANVVQRLTVELRDRMVTEENE